MPPRLLGAWLKVCAPIMTLGFFCYLLALSTWFLLLVVVVAALLLPALVLSKLLEMALLFQEVGMTGLVLPELLWRGCSNATAFSLLNCCTLGFYYFIFDCCVFIILFIIIYWSLILM